MNLKLKQWVEEVRGLCRPATVYWCDGSKAEYDRLAEQMVANGMARRLDSKKKPNSLYFHSDPSDVARVEDRTYISTAQKDEAGPTNNWVEPAELKRTMTGLYTGCMQGRTMYVIPFSMGPIGSPLSKIGVELTDSPYVVINMHIMTRVGTRVLEALGEKGDFVPCLHSVGAPLEKGKTDAAWPCAPIEKKYICHFPEENLIWSYGSGYGGNALLGKKCFALRIASNMARREGWMAEHMLILRLISPEGRKFHICAAFPSACGKTNLAMLRPSVPGWKAECLGDDIAWIKPGPDGRLYAINPESGFFGVAPGTSLASNPMAMETLRANSIFTNTVLTADGDVWWEGMGVKAPEKATDWKGKPWSQAGGEKGAHPNARFTAPAAQCPVISPDWEDPRGVPIDIFIFGGRRSTVTPLVTEAFDWDHGVFLGATACSETTAANIGSVGSLRFDPFAMLPFCGYNMGDYFSHWLAMGDRLKEKAPRLFYVNWFRKDRSGNFLWPGYGENSRVLVWMCERLLGKAPAERTPIGFVPTEGALNLSGLDVSADTMRELLAVDAPAWRNDLAGIGEHLNRFGKRLPERIRRQYEALGQRLTQA
jgi:phosphoenolpyruvate carboxykinase (GTP)